MYQNPVATLCIAVLLDGRMPELLPNFTKYDLNFLCPADKLNLMDILDDKIIPELEAEIDARIEIGEQDVEWDYIENYGYYSTVENETFGLTKAKTNLEILQNLSNLLCQNI